VEKITINILGAYPIPKKITARGRSTIVGKEPGSKYEKAKKLDIKIINEKEFLEMIR